MQFVLNYEEGGENSVLHGDPGSEQFLSEMFNPASYPDRHLSMESIYEYGSRAGVWRILREFEKRRLPLTVFGVGMASAIPSWPRPASSWATRSPATAGAGCIPGRGRGHRARTHVPGHAGHRAADRRAPAGLVHRPRQPAHARLVADYGGFEYDSDYYGDDLPFWMQVRRSDGKVVPQLIVPYTLDCNDMRFALPQGYSHAEPFFQYLKDSFDALYAEGDETPRCSASACIAACWAGRPHRGAAALPGLHRGARSRLDLPPAGHRPPLARHPSLPSTR